MPTINSALITTVQQSADGKGFKLNANNQHEPWASTAEFLGAMPLTRRHKGMFAYIGDNSSIDTWHFVGGISNAHLVKIDTSSYNAIDIAYKIPADSPLIGSNTYQNDLLKGATGLSFIIVNKIPETEVDGDYTFDSDTGEIIRTNTFFEGDSIIIKCGK